jgi:hypothetical protein
MATGATGKNERTRKQTAQTEDRTEPPLSMATIVPAASLQQVEFIQKGSFRKDWFGKLEKKRPL